MKTITLSGTVGYEITAEKIKEQVKENSTEKLQVIVNSPGGYVSDAFEIYNFFKMYKGEVEFVISGMAASAMSYIIMSGNKISAFKNSIFMAHKAWGLAIGNADDLQKEAELMGAMDSILAEAYSVRLGKEKEEVLKMMGEELWLIGWEPLTEAGIIDNVIDKDEEIEWEESEDSDAIKEELEELDKCGDDKEKQSKAKLKVIQCQSRMRSDADRARQASEKAVALISAENNKTESQPAEPENDKTKTEAHMNLQDFLKSNPEAKAEYDEALLSAEAKGAESVKADIGNDRKRIAEILGLAGVVLTEESKEAIENNISSGDFAKAELAREVSKRQNTQKSDFAGLVAKQTPEEQDEGSAKEVKAEKEFDEEKMRENVKAALSGIGG